MEESTFSATFYNMSGSIMFYRTETFNSCYVDTTSLKQVKPKLSNVISSNIITVILTKLFTFWWRWAEKGSFQSSIHK